MQKTKTGVCFTPEEYRNLNHCVSCSKACAIGYGEMCDECKATPMKFCDVCGIRLRDGSEKFYKYDNNDDLRDHNDDLKVSKNLIREFVILRSPFSPPLTDSLCTGCQDWKKKIKHTCWVCGDEFENSKENYKENGNCCGKCVAKYNGEIQQA